MKILWFEITVPSRYNSAKTPIAGWQDALQDLIVSKTDIELGIAFEYEGVGEFKSIDGVKYFPINTNYDWFEKQLLKKDVKIAVNKIINKAKSIVDEFKPDAIHIFGSEWCYGLLAEYVDIPIVIHMQGSIPSYNNALLPPLYSEYDVVVGLGLNLKNQLNSWFTRKKNKARQAMEERILRHVNYYMGRTSWDKAITKLYNPHSTYFYCSEALRQEFLDTDSRWIPLRNKKTRIVTTGVSSFWKGIDTILRTAHKLKETGFDFEWILVGNMNPLNKKVVEHKEGVRFDENNVIITGFLNSSQLKELLLSSDLYVHTAYIDNSPNSICEAQYLGMPIIATYVGGIPSLIESGKDGLLIPANDPFTLAGLIMDLANDKGSCISLGQASMIKARKRHNPDCIIRDLLHCYKEIIESYEK